MSASKLIDKQISGMPDWQGKLAVKIRQLVHEADPDIVEDWKWDTAVFVHKKMICAFGSFKDHFKINFFAGATLADPHKLFNSGLEAKKSRTIDFFEGDKINESAFKELIQAAVKSV